MRKTLSIALVAIAVLYSQKQMDDAVCTVSCLKDPHNFFDSGFIRKGHCLCIVDKGLLSDYSHGQIKIRRESTDQAAPEPVAKFKEAVEEGHW